LLLNNEFLLPTLSLQGMLETENDTEETSLSTQQIEGLRAEVDSSSNQSDIDSIRQTEHDLNTDNKKEEELEQRTNRGSSYLSSIRKNISGITTQLPKLEPKDWILPLSVCVISVLYQIYTARALERKHEVEFEQMLNKLLRQT